MAQLAAFTPPELERIRARLRAGESVSAVAEELGLSRNTVASWWRRDKAEGEPGTTVSVEATDGEFETQLAEAAAKLAAAEALGLPVASLRVGRKSYPTWERTDEDSAATTVEGETRNVELVLRPRGSEEGAPFEVRQAQPVEVTVQGPSAAPTERDARLRWAVVMPDAQRPFVDHAAVDVAHQVLAEVQRRHGVDRIIHLGDDLDLPDLGKHRSAPAALGLIQEAIDDQHRALAVERSLCPDAAITWLEGNHEARLVSWLVDHAPTLIGLARAGERNSPVLSVPYLTRLDELGVEYLDPYPEPELWLNSHLRAIHGDIVKGAKGQTAAAYLAQGQVSTIYGHIHRAELVSQTRHTKQGPRTYLAGSPGCLCRIDGVVPSAKSGINSHGRPGKRRTEDWQQGVWVVSYETTGKQLFTVEPVSIWGGWAQWRGQSFRARCDADGRPVQSDG